MKRAHSLWLVLAVVWADPARGSGCPPVDFPIHSFDRVSQMACAPNGSVVLADADYDRLRIYGTDGNLLGTIGSSGSGLGQFSVPSRSSASTARSCAHSDRSAVRSGRSTTLGPCCQSRRPGRFESPIRSTTAS